MKTPYRVSGLGSKPRLGRQKKRRGSALPLDRARVKDIRRALRNGDYTLRPECIAVKLIRLETALDAR